MYSISRIGKILCQRPGAALAGAFALTVAIHTASVAARAADAVAPAGTAAVGGAATPAAHRPFPPEAKPIALPDDLAIPDYRPGPNPFRDGESLVYAASWMDIPAGEARVMIVRNRARPDLWSGQMWLDTSPVVDMVYRMRDYFREDFAVATLRPDNIQILQHEKRRIDRWRVSFDRPARTVTAIKVNRRGRITTRRFTGGDPLGPFSGVMMALSQRLRPGDDLKFDIFSGGNRYVFDFNVTGRERITTALGTFDTVRIEPSVIWLSEGSFRTQARQTTIWVTDDARHLPVRIAAAVFFGNVYADLVSVSGAPFGALGPTVAPGSAAPRATTNPYAGLPTVTISPPTP